MMEKKTKEELKSEIKDLIKVNNKNFVEHQKVERELSSIIATKEEKIFKLKKEIGEKECNCHNYSKSVDEIYEAGIKHREKLVALVDVSEDFKKKISILREDKASLLAQVEFLEVEVEMDKAILERRTAHIIFRT